MIRGRTSDGEVDVVVVVESRAPRALLRVELGARAVVMVAALVTDGGALLRHGARAHERRHGERRLRLLLAELLGQHLGEHLC